MHDLRPIGSNGLISGDILGRAMHSGLLRDIPESPQIRTGIWSRSCLPPSWAERQMHCWAREAPYSTHSAPPMTPPSPDSTPRAQQAHSRRGALQNSPTSPWIRKTGHRLCGSPQSTQSHKPTTESGHWCLASSLNLVASKQVAGTPHGQEDLTPQRGAGRRQNQVCVFERPWRPLA